MSNRRNHRKPESSRNRQRAQRRPARSCGGEGANGARGRTGWKRLGNRARRHAAPEELPGIETRRGRPLVNPSLEDEESDWEG